MLGITAKRTFVGRRILRSSFTRTHGATSVSIPSIYHNATKIRQFSSSRVQLSISNLAAKPKEDDDAKDEMEGEQPSHKEDESTEHAVISTFDLFSIGGESISSKDLAQM